jgi:M6 family metalloprotease-like protein
VADNKKSFLLKNFLSYLFQFLTLIFCFSQILFSAPHISGKYIPGQPKDKVKILPDVSHLRFRGAPAIEIAKTLGVVGTKKVAVIIVDFPDVSFSSGWHNQANTTFSELKKYYSEVSYNKLSLEITFFYKNGFSTATLTADVTPYTMPKLMSYYGQDTYDSLSKLVIDAINATNTGVNAGLVTKSSFNYVMVLHAGNGNESTSDDNDIWSVYVDWNGAVNGFTDGTIVPESEKNASPVGVTCHEFGHQLGLPDLYYQYGTSQYSRVGKWCLMDYGTWLGNPQGSSPSHLSAWCKQYLGWAEVVEISSTVRNYSLPYCQSVSTGFIKIPILTSDDPQKEYFLLEYRKKMSSGYDSALPGEGVLIWRVDDTIASDPERLKKNDINSGVPHYGIDLVEADKTSAGDNYGDSGDPFPGSRNITNFYVSDYNITAYNGTSFPLSIKNISVTNSVSTFDILYELNLQQVAQGELVIGNNYTYAGRLMLIGFNLSKEDDVEINVYDLSGRIVKTFKKQTYPSGKNQIMWYGTDDDGKLLSPGLYFITLKTSSERKIEKFVIKRPQ